MNNFDSKGFLSWCQAECKRYDVTLKRSNYKSIRCQGLPVGGYFDAYNNEKPIIHIAGKHKIWEEILSHEISHMFQWVNNTKKWQDAIDIVNTDDWLLGKRVTQKKLNKAIVATIKMERECECHALKLLKTFGYNKGESYIQRANAYTLFYFHMMNTRQWYKRNFSPYDHPEIWKKFPKTFSIDIYKTYNKLSSLYDNCIEKPLN